MSKKLQIFNNILKNILLTNNYLLFTDLYDYYNNNKLEIQPLILSNKNNIINIDDDKFNLFKINSLESYKIVVTKYCNFIDFFFLSNEEINEKNINSIIIDIINYLNMRENIINYIINIPEHSNFFYTNNLHLYNEFLILDNCIKRTNKSLYKILIKNLVYYKIKNDK
jgi:hypothetical protein